MIKIILLIFSIFATIVVANAQNTKPIIEEKQIIAKDTVKLNIEPDTINTVPYSVWKIFKETARASYYADMFHGRTMANGKKFDMNKLSVAHKSLRFGTKLKVTNLKNNKSVIVEVTDRGPYVKSREIDLSKKAFLDITNDRNCGLLSVKIEIMK